MDEKKFIITKIAWLYYISNCTQQEIADELNLSRTKVTRYLQQAKDLGIVKVSVSLDYGFCFDKEAMLKDALGLTKVSVVPSSSNNTEGENGLGVAGALRMNNLLSESDIVGAAWGKSLYSVAKNLKPIKQKDGKQIQVVQLMGGLSISDKFNPEEVVKMITNRLGAQGNWMNMPAIVSSKEAKDILMNDDMIAHVFNRTKTCTVCMLGIGDLTETSSLYLTGSFTRQDLDELNKAGAVGDIISRPFNIDGVPIHTSLTDRIMAISLEEIKKIPKRIAFAVGKKKIKPIIGAARGGYINELVTDEETADGIKRYLDAH